MIHSIIKEKSTRLFLILGGFFIANALIAEIIGVKLFSLEKTLHMMPANMTIFGEAGLGFTLTVGIIIWPVVFIMTDIINEYYGVKGVRFLSLLTASIIAFAFGVFYIAIHLAPDDFWLGSQNAGCIYPNTWTRNEHHLCITDRIFNWSAGRRNHI